MSPGSLDSGGSTLAVSPRNGVIELVRRLAHSQIVRFGIIGVVNTAFSFGVFAGLHWLAGARVHYLVVVVVSNVVSVIEAFVLQRAFVFRVRGPWVRDLARFSSVYLVALGVNLAALPILVEFAMVPLLPAQAIVMLVTALGTFVVHRRYTFRRPGSADERSRSGTA